MVTHVVLPKFGLLMKEGRIVRWRKEEGERVEKGEPLFEVETEKVIVEVEAPASGLLRAIVAKEGSIVPIGELVAVITEPGEELAMPQPEKIEEVKKPVSVVERRVRISPLARKLAEEHGIDIMRIKGTGPGGRIVKKDVVKVIEEARVVPAIELAKVAKVIPMTTMRKRIAERLSESHHKAVHVTITTEVDMTEAVKLRQAILPQIEESHGVRVSFTDILVKAVAKALREYPTLNSTLEGDQIKVLEDIHVGIAVSLEEGLMVPIVRSAYRRSLAEIALAAERLIEKAKKGTLSSDEVTGGTFTITNLGMYGVDVFTPVINPPETAILGVGRIVEKPVVANGQIVVKSMMSLSLSFDHRVVDGALAAQFLQRVKQILEKPFLLLR